MQSEDGSWAGVQPLLHTGSGDNSMEFPRPAQHQASSQNPRHIHSSQRDSAQGSGSLVVPLLMSEQGLCVLRACCLHHKGAKEQREQPQ